MFRLAMGSLLGTLILSAWALGADAAEHSVVTATPVVSPSAAAQSSEASLPSVDDAVTSMEQALREVALLVEAARSDRKPNVIACLVQKMAQIGKHLRFAKKVEVEQFDAAVRLKDPGAPDIARAVAKRLTMVLELRAQAAACAGDYA